MGGGKSYVERQADMFVACIIHWGKEISGHVPTDGHVDIKKTCSLNRPTFNNKNSIAYNNKNNYFNLIK